MNPDAICHMGTSLDGKIIGHRWGKLPGYQHERGLCAATTVSFGIGADAKNVWHFEKDEVGGDHVVLLVTDGPYPKSTAAAT